MQSPTAAKESTKASYVADDGGGAVGTPPNFVGLAAVPLVGSASSDSHYVVDHPLSAPPRKFPKASSVHRSLSLEEPGGMHGPEGTLEKAHDDPDELQGQKPQEHLHRRGQLQQIALHASPDGKGSDEDYALERPNADSGNYAFQGKNRAAAAGGATSGNACEAASATAVPGSTSAAAEPDLETVCRQTFIFANSKAGMDMTEEEKAKIAAKIFELSRNSPFYANEMRCFEGRTCNCSSATVETAVLQYS